VQVSYLQNQISGVLLVRKPTWLNGDSSSNPISGCGIIVFDVLKNGKGILPIVTKKLNPGTLVLCKHHLLKAKHSCCVLPQWHKTYFL